MYYGPLQKTGLCHCCMVLTVTPLEPEGLSDVKLLSQMCGKMNLPPSRFSSGLWTLMKIASLTPLWNQEGLRSSIFTESIFDFKMDTTTQFNLHHNFKA